MWLGVIVCIHIQSVYIQRCTLYIFDGRGGIWVHSRGFFVRVGDIFLCFNIYFYFYELNLNSFLVNNNNEETWYEQSEYSISLE